MDRPINTFSYYDRPLPAQTRPRVAIPLLAVLVVLCAAWAWMRMHGLPG